MDFGLTGHINASVSAIAIQVVIGEAGSGHEPRSFSDDFRSVTVRVSVNAVEHFSITAGFSNACDDGVGMAYQITAATLFPGRSLLYVVAKSSGRTIQGT